MAGNIVLGDFEGKFINFVQNFNLLGCNTPTECTTVGSTAIMDDEEWSRGKGFEVVLEGFWGLKGLDRGEEV
jgi:hypothetical protein